MSTPIVTIPTHTTASSPRPHILYSIRIKNGDTERVVQRRYSDFVNLHSALGAAFSLPPKRIMTTAFLPSAWLDDALIAERKAGLASYLAAVLAAGPQFADHPALKTFLSSAEFKGRFNPEDAIPSTLSRKAALDLLSGADDGEVRAQAQLLAASYYPDWAEGTIAPEAISFGKFDVIFFAFATPNSSSTLSWDSSSSTSLVKRLVSAANSSGKGTKVALSVGGWGGSTWFSQAVSSSANRTTFVNSISSAINTYGLAGVDIDWEYPNSAGAGNPHSPNDAANLLSFLTQLRSTIGSSKIISAAVPHLPWLGSNGQPLTNVSAYAAQMTYVNIMNYDVWGASSSPGPNAPLGNLCGTSKQPQASAQAAFAQWTAAGFPASKLLLGLPLYGYVSNSTKTGVTGSFAPTEEMRSTALIPPKKEDEEQHFYQGAHPRDKDAPTKIRAAANLQGWYGQQIPFSEIVSSGALVKQADGSYGQGGGFTMGWDDCSDTPFLYNTSQSTFVTYDDTFSLADKASYAQSKGMAGCFTWSLDQDDGHTLMDAIRTAMGRAPPPS
ncbi:glycoside hydrolase family 18 protein [Exidia glandulosa HHB12029]|uniref:Glycoside hydrolase family 18 protein n=1 Tax=Exidia glandulosa HHB12029 TaxID=1314781 RepID=A0A165KKZ7_EXIGL|nr:glycoside hydrolase family 18 protein [Exidia glandulosa HHB12029]